MVEPLWLLDVDGVLNAVCVTVPPGYERRRINGFQITWNPAIVTRLRQLHETGAVEIRWLTTWCELAAEHIAPGLGLPLDCVVEGSEDHLNTDHKAFISGKQKEPEPAPEKRPHDDGMCGTYGHVATQADLHTCTVCGVPMP